MKEVIFGSNKLIVLPQTWRELSQCFFKSFCLHTHNQVFCCVILTKVQQKTVKKKTDKEENDSLQGCSIMANLLFCCMEYLLQRKMAWLSLQTMYAYTQHSFLGERHVLTYSATTVSSRFGLVRCNDGLKQHYIQCF